MVAFSASRLVWPAIALIRRSTSPIFSPAVASPPTISLVFAALPTAASATSLEWVTWRPISATEEASSSVAAATVLMLEEASSEAAAAAAACAEVPLQRALFHFALLLRRFLRLTKLTRLDHVAAEHVDGAGHRAEFVLAVAAGD